MGFCRDVDEGFGCRSRLHHGGSQNSGVHTANEYLQSFSREDAKKEKEENAGSELSNSRSAMKPAPDVL